MEQDLRDKESLKRVLDRCYEVLVLTAELKGDFQNYKHNWRMQHLLSFCIMMVGENMNKLSADFRERHLEIPFFAIVGMRNIVAHTYDKVDQKLVWSTALNDIPLLYEQLKEIAEDDFCYTYEEPHLR